LNENKKRLETWREIEIPQELREAMIARILAIELGKEGGVPTRTQNRIEALEYSIDRECGDIGDNLLGLFQGVTHYTTHVMAQKERVFGNIIGRSHEINKKAFEFCTQVENGSRPNLIFGNN